MKVRILALYIASLSSIMAYAVGEVKWISTTHDFGTFNEESGNVKCNISFVNTGDEDVVILNVRPTCGCTASDYPRRPITPGDTASIQLVYNPQNRPGKFSKDVIVSTNTIPKRHTITIQGCVIGDATTIQKKYPISIGNLKIDSAIVPFGEIKKGQNRSAFINGYNTGSDSIKVTWKDVPSHISIISNPAIVPPGELTTISIFYESSKTDDWGFAKSSFSLVESTTNASQEIEIIALINEDFTNISDKEQENAPRIKLESNIIDCGKVTNTEEFVTKEFTIANSGKSDLIIRQIYTLDKGVSINNNEGVIKQNEKSVFTITIDPRQIKGNIINAKLSIVSNDWQKSNTTIRIIGEIKK